MSTQTEQEQIEELKNFWTEYGKPIFIGILLAITVVAVWKFWENRQLTTKMKEAQNYQMLVIAMSQPIDQVKEADLVSIADQLQEANPNSYYAQYAKFYLAKVAVHQGKLEDAAKSLQVVLDKPADKVLEELARQRLAQVLAAQDKMDEALKLLDAPVAKAFTASRQELKGDLLLKQGNTEQARTAYQEALTAAETAKSANLVIIKLKLNDLAKEGA